MGPSAAPRRKRALLACDACRVRKIKCDLADLQGEGSALPTSRKCSGCSAARISCSFNQQRRKPGPPPGYLERLRDEADEGQPEDNMKTSSVELPAWKHPLGEPKFNDTAAQNLTDDHPPMPDMRRNAGGMFSWTASDLPSTGQDPAPTLAHSQEQADRATVLESIVGGGQQNTSDTWQESLLLSSSTQAAHASTHILFGDIIPHDMLASILDTYFDNVHCVAPFPHEPSLRRDVANRRETLPGQGGWTTMVLAMAANTLVQAPQQLSAKGYPAARDMVDQLVTAIRRFLVGPNERASTERAFINFSLSVVLNLVGHPVMAMEYHAASVAIALELKLDYEDTYASLNPLESEMRRRFWWLLYCVDQTVACCEDGRRLLCLDDYGHVTLPRNIDDAFFDENGFREKPPGAPSRLSGFRYSCSLWRLAGQLLSCRENDTRHPPSGSALDERLSKVDELIRQLDRVMDDCPPHLRLRPAEANDIVSLPTNLEDCLQSDPDYWLSLTESSSSNPRREHLVQQANIYLTQLNIRLVGMYHRRHLIERIHELARENGEGSPGTRPTTSAPTEAQLDLRPELGQVRQRLMEILGAIPLELIAINSIAVVFKLRFIISTLLAGLGGSPSDEWLGLVKTGARDHAQVQGLLEYYQVVLTHICNLYNIS